MLQKQRVFDITNTILNYAFLVYVLLCALYFCSFWLALEGLFLSFIVSVINIYMWTMVAMSLVQAVLALLIVLIDRSSKALAMIWTLVRMLLCVVLAGIISMVSTIVSQGLHVSI